MCPETNLSCGYWHGTGIYCVFLPDTSNEWFAFIELPDIILARAEKQ